MTNAYREPGHCITASGFAYMKDELYGPSAVWTFTNLSDAQSWRTHLRQQWRRDSDHGQRARIFERSLRVAGAVIVIYCLVLDRGPAIKAAK